MLNMNTPGIVKDVNVSNPGQEIVHNNPTKNEIASGPLVDLMQ